MCSVVYVFLQAERENFARSQARQARAEARLQAQQQENAAQRDSERVAEAERRVAEAERRAAQAEAEAARANSQVQALQQRNTTCDHVYVGQTWYGGFSAGFGNETVIGVNPRTGWATVRRETNGYTREMRCSEI